MKERVRNKTSFISGTIRVSLAMVVPILFIGSITVLLGGFPIQGYQDFLDTFLNGALRTLIGTIQNVTVGALALYLTAAISINYMKQRTDVNRVSSFGNLMGCIAGFFILAGFFTGTPDLSLLSGQGVFSALLAGIFGSILFSRYEAVFKVRKPMFVDGADAVFNASLHVILPFICVVATFAAANFLITIIFKVESVQYLFMKIMKAIFLRMQRSFASGLLFTTLISVMWCFGIHGNNILNQVAEDMFTAIIPGQIVSKSFIDTFVNMGGSGCTIGLLLAMIIFGRRRSTKKLSGMAVLPGIFNISEMMLFGFPVIYNPIMMIPFIISPMICYTSAYLLTMTGFLPQVTTSVVWTTPAVMSGYLATGSAMGIVVQIINILISTAIYAPFVIRYEKKSLRSFSTEMKGLEEMFKESEESGRKVVLTECEGIMGRMARLLASDLEDVLFSFDPEGAESPLAVNYRFEHGPDGSVTGAESFITWNHIRHGEVYPPLILKVAQESRDLYELETFGIDRAVSAARGLKEQYGESFVIKVNVSAATFCDPGFVPFLQDAADRHRMKMGSIRIVPENDAEIDISKDDERIQKIKALGYII